MFPEVLTIDIGPSINRAVEALITDHGSAFRAVADGILVILVGIEGLFRHAPWWVVVAAVAAASYAAARKPWPAAAAAAVMLAIGSLGLWDAAMQTLALMVVAVSASVALGVPMGVLFARSRRLSRVARPVLDAMQTLPSFVYLVPAMMLFGLGKVPALLATVIYAVAPVVRLTELGIRQADSEAVESADAFGATPRQRLWLVELPLALPSIMAGINQATMMALSMVVVASMIGARGLGEEVLLGIQRLDVGRSLVAGTVIVLLAVVMDRLTQNLGRRLPHVR